LNFFEILSRIIKKSCYIYLPHFLRNNLPLLHHAHLTRFFYKLIRLKNSKKIKKTIKMARKMVFLSRIIKKQEGAPPKGARTLGAFGAESAFGPGKSQDSRSAGVQAPAAPADCGSWGVAHEA